MIGAHQAFRQDRYRFLRRGWVLWLVMALGVVAFVLLTGRRFRGAVMAAGNMTPTEILKLLVPLAVAGFLSRKEVDTPAGRKGKGKGKATAGSEALEWGPLMGFAAMLMLIIGGLVYQKDLGMVLILSVSIGFQIFAGTGAWWILPLMAFGMIGGVGIVQKLFPHALARFDVWLNPFADPTGGGWQILQSFSGMYSGGLWGEGWGQGDPERIPIAKSDFIYSVIAEEMGFLGCLLLIAIFCIFINRAWRIAESVPTRFGCLLGSGLVSVFAVQLLVNIGGVVKVLPMTGVPLIFVSHGGTSLVTSLLILGFILSLNDSAANFPGNTRKKTPSRNRSR
jgi:cell division protein FtsW (lipid II flippase)